MSWFAIHRLPLHFGVGRPTGVEGVEGVEGRSPRLPPLGTGVANTLNM